MDFLDASIYKSHFGATFKGPVCLPAVFDQLRAEQARIEADERFKISVKRTRVLPVARGPNLLWSSVLVKCEDVTLPFELVDVSEYSAILSSRNGKVYTTKPYCFLWIYINSTGNPTAFLTLDCPACLHEQKLGPQRLGPGEAAAGIRVKQNVHAFIPGPSSNCITCGKSESSAEHVDDDMESTVSSCHPFEFTPLAPEPAPGNEPASDSQPAVTTDLEPARQSDPSPEPGANSNVDDVEDLVFNAAAGPDSDCPMLPPLPPKVGASLLPSCGFSAKVREEIVESCRRFCQQDMAWELNDPGLTKSVFVCPQSKFDSFRKDSLDALIKADIATHITKWCAALSADDYNDVQPEDVRIIWARLKKTTSSVREGLHHDCCSPQSWLPLQGSKFPWTYTVSVYDAPDSRNTVVFPQWRHVSSLKEDSDGECGPETFVCESGSALIFANFLAGVSSGEIDYSMIHYADTQYDSEELPDTDEYRHYGLRLRLVVRFAVGCSFLPLNRKCAQRIGSTVTCDVTQNEVPQEARQLISALLNTIISAEGRRQLSVALRTCDRSFEGLTLESKFSPLSMFLPAFRHLLCPTLMIRIHSDGNRKEGQCMLRIINDGNVSVAPSHFKVGDGAPAMPMLVLRLFADSFEVSLYKVSSDEPAEIKGSDSPSDDEGPGNEGAPSDGDVSPSGGDEIGERLCGKCRQPGHDRRKCPQLISRSTKSKNPSSKKSKRNSTNSEGLYQADIMQQIGTAKKQFEREAAALRAEYESRQNNSDATRSYYERALEAAKSREEVSLTRLNELLLECDRVKRQAAEESASSARQSLDAVTQQFQVYRTDMKEARESHWSEMKDFLWTKDDIKSTFVESNAFALRLSSSDKFSPNHAAPVTTTVSDEQPRSISSMCKECRAPYLHPITKLTTMCRVLRKSHPDAQCISCAQVYVSTDPPTWCDVLGEAGHTAEKL